MHDEDHIKYHLYNMASFFLSLSQLSPRLTRHVAVGHTKAAAKAFVFGAFSFRRLT